MGIVGSKWGYIMLLISKKLETLQGDGGWRMGNDSYLTEGSTR